MKKLEFNLKTVLVKVIVQTTDLTNFTFLTGYNRLTSRAHINEIKKSFELFGNASATATVVETKCLGKIEYYIADGQHRIIAAIELGLPMNITIVRLEEDTILNLMKYISMLNNTSVSWGNKQYLNSFANCNIGVYKLLQKVANESTLTVTDLHNIFLENDRKLIKDFKNGDLVALPNEKDSLELYKAVLKVKSVIPNKAFTRRSLYKSMRKCNDYNKFAIAIIKCANLMKKAQQKFSENEIEFFGHLERIRKSTFATKK